MIPIEFLNRLRDIVPPALFDGVKDSMYAPKATSFRVNALRSSLEEVLDLLQEVSLKPNNLSWYSDGMWVSHDQRAHLLNTDVYAEQKIYVQNQSSMLPPLILAPASDDRVLDLAAAPGSKTLQLACLMDQGGELAAVDAVKKRFFKLKDNLSAQGATKVRTFLKDGRSVWKSRPEYFDRVLLDAPCSSEGRFHISDPTSFAYWSERKIKEMARKQKRLLFSAINALKPGGAVVYSTCSFAPEENEVIVNDMLRRFGEAIEVVPLDIEIEQMTQPLFSWGKKTFHPQLHHARRILPSYHTDGFFICKLKKHTSTLNQ